MFNLAINDILVANYANISPLEFLPPLPFLILSDPPNPSNICDLTSPHCHILQTLLPICKTDRLSAAQTKHDAIQLSHWSESQQDTKEFT